MDPASICAEPGSAELPADFRTAAPAQSFLDWPVVTQPADWQADIALMGIPQSEPYAGETCPNDQSRAPGAVRTASSRICDGASHWDFDFGATLQEIRPARCIDIGDFVWRDGSYDDHFGRIAAGARTLWRSGVQVWCVGGDHGVTIPLLYALEAVGQPVHVIHVDAHLDWRDEVGGVRRGYSSPLRRASELPWIRGITHIGLRGTGSARRPEIEAARAWGADIVLAEDVHRSGIEPVLDRLPLGIPFFITIDADGLDPACMPAVAWPSPGGLRYEQVLGLVRGAARRAPVVGMDVVEISPVHDTAHQISCVIAGRLFINLMAATRLRERGTLASEETR